MQNTVDRRTKKELSETEVGCQYCGKQRMEIDMENQLQHFMEKASFFEEKGYLNEAIQLCNKCIEAFPEEENNIKLEIAKIKCRNGRMEEALIQLLLLYKETEAAEIHNLILEVYYKSREREFLQRIQENGQELENYRYYFGTRPIQEIRYYPIWTGEKKIVYYDKTEKNFQLQERYQLNIEEPVDSVWIASDILWLEDILQLEKISRKVNPYMDYENPLLLVYQKKTWDLLLQIVDLKEITRFDRIILYENPEQLETPFLNNGIQFPKMSIGNISEEIVAALNGSRLKYEQNCEKYKMEVTDYYKENGKKVIQHIVGQKPRILFMTSRFTTTLQYHIRDCRKAAERMGAETDLLIEPDRLNIGHTPLRYIRKLSDFKPDIIFSIDHFRFEHNIMEDVENVVWVTWIQDHMPCILDKKTPGMLLEKDFIMNHFISWDVIKDVGYPVDRTMDAPIVANEEIYKVYPLTTEEMATYGADICMVCHASDVETHIERILCSLGENKELKIITEQLLYDYCRLVTAEEIILYTKEEISGFIDQYTRQFCNMPFSASLIAFLAEQIYMDLNQRIYRQAIADWLIEAGYKNIKLWGNGWLNNPKYQAYAMGPAPNGEILSKILQSSKIVLGNNFNATGAARAWESMLSGAFYMSNYVPPEKDIVDIRKVMRENDEIIMFNNKQDLLNKVDYYLSHEEEREQMAKKGHQKALETMTFTAFMKRMLAFIKKSFEEKSEV